MSSSKAFIALALAISVGIFAVIVATLYLDQRSASSASVVVAEPPPIPTKKVVVLAKPIKAHTLLDESYLKVAAIPLHELPPNHVVNPIDLVGRRVAVAGDVEEPLLLNQLVPREMDIELDG